MMATFEGINWPALGVILACLSALSSIGLAFGKTTQRITAIEDTLREDIKPDLKRLEKKMDENFAKLYDLLLKKQ